MATLKEMTQALHRDLDSHGGRIKELRRLVEIAEDEIAIHEAVLELGRNERLISAINELGSGDLSSGNEVVSDFGRYCTEQKIPIPTGVTFVQAGADGEPLPLRAEVRRGRAIIEISWSPEIGFLGGSVIPQLSYIINAPS
jgi:hypothetical protein